MANLNHLLSMGGYGIYVWPAYVITLAVFGINIFSSLKEKRAAKKIIQQYLLSQRKT